MILTSGIVPSETPVCLAQVMAFSYQVEPPVTSWPSMRARMVISMARVVFWLPPNRFSPIPDIRPRWATKSAASVYQLFSGTSTKPVLLGWSGLTSLFTKVAFTSTLLSGITKLNLPSPLSVTVMVLPLLSVTVTLSIS